MRVLFAPDYRKGNPYQQFLADALASERVEVAFLSHYRRGLPLARGCRDQPVDLLHLHWPEAYYSRRFDGFDLLRVLRFPLDLALAMRRLPMVMTAHNLLPHGRQQERWVARNGRLAYRRARAVFTHSIQSGVELTEKFGVPSARLVPIPTGGLGLSLGQPIPRALARETLAVNDQPMCLMFGAVEPYKGIEAVINYWKSRPPGIQLVIAGNSSQADYAEKIRLLAAGCPDIRVELRWLSDAELNLWLGAADCALFNYESILTSGSAMLAHSRGLPLLLPHRLTTIDLGEPRSIIFKFSSLETDFANALGQAVAMSQQGSALKYCHTDPWKGAAEITKATYARCLEETTPTMNQGANS